MTEVTITKQERNALWSAMRLEMNNASDNLAVFSRRGVDEYFDQWRDFERIAHVASLFNAIGWSRDHVCLSVPLADLQWAVEVTDNEARALLSDGEGGEEHIEARALCHRMRSRMGEAVAV